MHMVAPQAEAPDQGEASRSELAPGALRRVFLDLVSRPPFEAEIEEWAGKPRVELVDSLLDGDEFWGAWLEEQLYYFLLIDNFRPVSEAVTDLQTSLREGRIGVLEALHRICLSSSFDRRNPGPDTFVSVVMEQLVGGTVQKTPRELEIGKLVYEGHSGNFMGKTANSQADIVNIAIRDGRATRYFLERESSRVLRQPSRPKDLDRWAARLESDALCYPDLLREWLASPDYSESFQRRLPESNRLFVRSLFVDVMGRLPSPDEGQRLRSALDGLADSGPLRSLVARLLLDSGVSRVPPRSSIDDPRAWIGSLFLRFLGRAATEVELVAFQESFADPACQTTTVFYALVSHPEYQTW